MIPAALSRRRDLPAPLRLLLLALLLAALALAVASDLLALQSSLPLVCVVALVGWLPRRSWLEALLLAVPVLLADIVELDVGPQLLSIVLLAIYAATLRPVFSVLLAGSLFGLFVAANVLKLQFAGTRLTWQDVRFFFARFVDNVGVLASQPTLVAYGAGVLLAVVGAACFGWRLDRRRAATGPARRWLSAGLCLLVAAWSGHAISAAAAVLRARSTWELGELAGYRSDPLLPFFAVAGVTPHWQPRSAPTDDFARMARQSHAGTTGAARRPADIVVFLQESQFNPAAIEGCPASLCGLPLFDARAETRAHGPLRVHVAGGGTWLTEFELATGVPHEAFGPAGDFAPFNVAPGTRQSFVRSLRAAGYRTVAVYPTRGGMMNGRQAYAGYGFDRFYDAPDLGLSGEFTTTDAAMHEAALRVLQQERAGGQPVFLLVLTIFNHGQHGVRMWRVPADLKARTAAAFPDPDQARNVADYLWRTQELQAVMQRTRQAVLSDERPAVLAWFGDHRPAFADAGTLGKRLRPLPAAQRIPPGYTTWYELESNVGSAARPPPAPLDVVFLPGLLAQTAGVPLDPWLQANVAAREACGGLLFECVRPEVRDAYLTHLWRDLKAFDLP